MRPRRVLPPELYWLGTKPIRGAGGEGAATGGAAQCPANGGEGPVAEGRGHVRNLIAGHVEDLTPLLGRLTTESRDVE
jgi:hypothetical protein